MFHKFISNMFVVVLNAPTKLHIGGVILFKFFKNYIKKLLLFSYLTYIAIETIRKNILANKVNHLQDVFFMCN